MGSSWRVWALDISDFTFDKETFFFLKCLLQMYAVSEVKKTYMKKEMGCKNKLVIKRINEKFVLMAETN